MIFEYAGALNAAILIAFLSHLTRMQRTKIFLILDNRRVHHSQLVKQLLAENAGKSEVLYLPGASPELNPNELLNAGLDSSVTTATPKDSQSYNPDRSRKPPRHSTNDRRVSRVTLCKRTYLMHRSKASGPR